MPYPASLTEQMLMLLADECHRRTNNTEKGQLWSDLLPAPSHVTGPAWKIETRCLSAGPLGSLYGPVTAVLCLPAFVF